MVDEDEKLRNWDIGCNHIGFIEPPLQEECNPKFPALKEPKNSDTEGPLHVYAFFSKKNCIECISFIEAPSHLPSHFVPFGIVPENELKDEKESKFAFWDDGKKKILVYKRLRRISLNYQNEIYYPFLLFPKTLVIKAFKEHIKIGCTPFLTRLQVESFLGPSKFSPF